MLTSIDLFSGIGGFSLALAPTCKTILYCDNSRNARNVLQSVTTRWRDEFAMGRLPPAEIVDDVKHLADLPSSKLPKADLICAGFPCQDVSVMNLYGKGLLGERSGLVFEAIRIARKTRASIIFLENSPNLRNRGLDALCVSLARAGYSKIAWGIFSASEVGAPHQRRRIYLLAVRNDASSMSTLQKLHIGLITSVTQHLPNWCLSSAPSRVIRKKEGVQLNVQVRGFLLGNSVVPRCARKACQDLAHLIANTSSRNSSFVVSRSPPKAISTHDVDNTNIKMIIPYYKHVSPHRKKIYHKSNWSTPLADNWWISRIGSLRATRHLPNQIMYERETLDYIRSRSGSSSKVDDWAINPEFIEWLMGYPLGWTECARKV